MDQNTELVIEIKKLGTKITNLSDRYNVVNLFFGGVLRGMGLIVGATLMVLVGSLILSLLGFFPAFSDIVEIIRDAFNKARV